MGNSVLYFQQFSSTSTQLTNKIKSMFVRHLENVQSLALFLKRSQGHKFNRPGISLWSFDLIKEI